MTPDTTMPVEKLEEILKGLEGVTPGPWYHVKGHGQFHLGWEVGAPNGAISASPKAEVSAHIARLDPDTVRSIITELLALRPAATQKLEVTVTPLEWVSDDGIFVAFSDCGRYSAYRTSARWWKASSRENGNLGSYPSAEAAKAAAQADYEARIRSALVPAPQVTVSEVRVEKAAKAAYVDWIKDVQDLEPQWEGLPESHKDRLRSCQRAAITAALGGKAGG